MVRLAVHWNYGQHDMGRVFGIVEDRLTGDSQLGVESESVARVWVAVELWEVATGHLDPDAVAC